MPILSKQKTSYSNERIRSYEGANGNQFPVFFFSLYDIDGNIISRIYVDHEDMEMDITINGNVTTTKI